MNKKQWTGLLMIYTSYLFLGATIFFYIETESEKEERTKMEDTYENLKKIIISKFDKDQIRDFETKISVYCDKVIDTTKDFNTVSPPIWDFYNSFFFVVTVVSTIGYGNLHPTTDQGRVIMIFYAIVGIPLNGILLTSLGQFFGEVFIRAHRKYKNHERSDSRFSLTMEVLTYLVPGCILFIFLPAGVFTYFEDWDYTQSVYYAFVTLTTIGFGDLVAGQKAPDGNLLPSVIIYQILLVCWVIFGLGYLIMLLGFVAQAMNSKKLVKLEHKLMTGLTHSRVWSGFSKDIGYLRRVVNELYLDKVKPVFRDHSDEVPQIIHRSKSLPDLTSAEEEAAALRRRQKRAMSENGATLTRVFSESDLQRIDRNATFAAVSAVPTTFELMRNVINAYSGAHLLTDYPPENEEIDGFVGVDGFSDEEVLSSEKWMDEDEVSKKSRHPSNLFYLPSYEDTVSRQPHRGRAMSECPPPDVKFRPPINAAAAPPVDWTWSGPAANKLHDVIKMKQKQRIAMGLRNGNMKDRFIDPTSMDKDLLDKESKKTDDEKSSLADLNNDRRGSLTASLIAGAKRLNPLRPRKRYITDEGRLNIEDDSGRLETMKHTFTVSPEFQKQRMSLQEDRILREFSGGDQHYETTTAAAGGPMSAADLLKMYSRGESLFGRERNNELLEETSLADFLRALTSLHSHVGEHLAASEQQKQPRPRRKLGTASMTPPRIRSLLDLFPDPVPQSPKPPKKRKPSKVAFPYVFRADSRSDISTLQTSNAPEDTPEKSQEPSNLKRLGRFILRSYSLVPKDLDDAGVAKTGRLKKRFSLWPSDADDKDSSNASKSSINPHQIGSTQSLNVAIQVEPDIPNTVTVSFAPPQAGTSLQIPQHTAINVAGDGLTQRSPAPQRKTSYTRWQPENPLGNVYEGKECP